MNPAITHPAQTTGVNLRLGFRSLALALTLVLLTGCAAMGARNSQAQQSLANLRAENDRKEADNKQHRQAIVQNSQQLHSTWLGSLNKKDQNHVLASEQQTKQESQANTLETTGSVLNAIRNAVKPDVYIDRR